MSATAVSVTKKGRLFFMPKNREKRKMRKKVGQMEEKLERKNEFDLKDLTPYNAVRTMQGKDIVYK